MQVLRHYTNFTTNGITDIKLNALCCLKLSKEMFHTKKLFSSFYLYIVKIIEHNLRQNYIQI